MTTDKTIKSKNQPKQTNVTWVDLSGETPVEKHFINGRWVAVSGGSSPTDISSKADKVSNATNGNFAGLDANGNLTDSGKKASDFATSSQGAKADTAYQKPQAGIPESDLSSDVQQALQKHFKGWYASSSALPANPVVGDYAYVKGAESTDPAAIYECTTVGSWNNSGRTADTSNVQTFASGEEVNETYIDGTHLVNPADGALPTAADVMQLKVKLEGVMATEVKVTQQPITGSFVRGADGTIGTASNVAYIEVQLGNAKLVRFLGGWYSSSSYTAGYAFGHYTDPSDPTTWRTDKSSVFDTDASVLGTKEYVILVPEDATHFRTTTATGPLPTLAQNFYCYLQSGKNVVDYIKNESYCVFEYVQGLYITNQGVVSTATSSDSNSYQIAYAKVNKGDIIHLRAIPKIMSVAQSYIAPIRVGFNQSIPVSGITLTNVNIYNSASVVSNRTIVNDFIQVDEDGYFYVNYPIDKRIHIYDITCSTIISTRKDNTIGVSQGRIYNGYPDGDKKYVTSDFIKGDVYFDLVCRDGYKINSVHLYDDNGKLICPNFIGESVHTGSRYRNRSGWGSILPPHIMARVTFVKNSNGCIADEDCLVENSPIKSLTYLSNENGYIKDIPNSIEAAYPFVQYRTKTLVYVLSRYLRFKENSTSANGLNRYNDYYNLNGRTYYGVSYSDSRNLPTIVGQDTSIYTYLTALNHKYSVVYTEDKMANSSMYGINYEDGGIYSIQYFEMACNMFWGYCMGKYAMKLTSNVVQSGYTKVFAGSASPSGNISDIIQTFDTLLKSGHVAFILDVIKKDNEVKYIVVAESTTPFTRITVYPKNAFDEYYMSNVGSDASPSYYDVWRKNTTIDANTYYQPFDSDNDEYVAHSSENYSYIGSSKECMLYVGDRASLGVNSPVYVNINRGYDKYTKLKLYKDNVLLQEINIVSLTKIANDPDGEDWVSVNLTSYIDGYGKYKAVASNNDGSVLSNETIWEIIDISLSVTPTIATFSVNGGKPYIIQEEDSFSGFLRYNCDLLESTDTTHNISSFTNNPKIALYAMGDYGVVKKVVDRVTN